MPKQYIHSKTLDNSSQKPFYAICVKRTCPDCMVQFKSRLKTLYCSACRKKRHPKERMKKDCQVCGAEFTVRGGQKYCSPACRDIGYKQTRKNSDKKSVQRYRKARQLINEFKENMGCQICGYRKFGGSIAFHHTEENKKDKEHSVIGIKPEHFFARGISDQLISELSTCALLCHNCHNFHHHKSDLDPQPMGREVAEDLFNQINSIPLA